MMCVHIIAKSLPFPCAVVPLFIVILSEAPDWTNYLEEEL